MKNGYYVYLYYDNNGQVLYLGKTKNLERRFREHFYSNRQQEYEYIKKVYSIQYAEFETEINMCKFESYCIDRYNPIYNKKNESINYCEDDFKNVYFKQYIYGFNPNPLNHIVEITKDKCIIESLINDNVKRLCPDCFTNEYYESQDGYKKCKFCGKVIAPKYVVINDISKQNNYLKKRFSLELVPKNRILRWKQSANSIEGFTGVDFML